MVTATFGAELYPRHLGVLLYRCQCNFKHEDIITYPLGFVKRVIVETDRLMFAYGKDLSPTPAQSSDRLLVRGGYLLLADNVLVVRHFQFLKDC